MNLQELETAIKRLRVKGKSIEEIAKMLGASEPFVRYILKDSELPIKLEGVADEQSSDTYQ